jgi:hypothetical protein
MSPGEEVVLVFEQGRLTSWHGTPPSSPVVRFFEERKRHSEATRDRNWNVFAELGIGLNPAISVLTGNSLFDEKAKKTIHVAIGDNQAFGHHVESNIHDDLVTWAPTLRLDGAVVLERGEFVAEALHRSRNGSHANDSGIPADVSFFLLKKKVHFRMEGNDRFLMRKLYKQYRVGFVKMAEPSVSRLLAKVADKLDTFNEVKLNEFLSEYPQFEGMGTEHLLSILHHYRVLGTTRF